MAPIVLAEVGSTNAWLLAHAAGLPDGQWVLALSQSAGRGRHGRGWTFLPGNLAASCLVRLGRMEGRAHELGFVAGLSLFEASARHAGSARLMLKWPNDLLLDGAKMAGILIEREGGQAVVGFGVNLAEAPRLSGREAAALRDAMRGPPPAPAAFLEDLAAAFAAWRARWEAEGFPPVRAAWLERAHPPGTPLEVRPGGTVVAGRFAGLAADGALLLETGSGRAQVVRAGDVVARPAATGR